MPVSFIKKYLIICLILLAFDVLVFFFFWSYPLVIFDDAGFHQNALLLWLMPVAIGFLGYVQNTKPRVMLLVIGLFLFLVAASYPIFELIGYTQ